MKKNLGSMLVFSLVAIGCFSCTSGTTPRKAKTALKSIDPKGPVSNKSLVNMNGKVGDSVAEVKVDYKPGEATEACKKSIETVRARLDKIAKLSPSQRTVDNTLLEFEYALAEYTNEISLIIFLGQVAPEEKMRSEGVACDNLTTQFSSVLSTRRDVYQAVSDVSIKPRNEWETRLAKKTMDAFEAMGMKLPDDQLKKAIELREKIANNETAFKKNLNDGNQAVEFTSEELAGLSKEILERSKKTTSGKMTFNTNAADYKLFMENVSNGEARKKMMTAYYNRALATNVKLLEDTILLRAQLAKLMGFKSWSDFKLANLMAKNSDTAMGFLGSLKEKLVAKNQSDLEQLLKAKKEIDPAATKVEVWDVDFLSAFIKKRDLGVDNEKIKEYFPSETVVQGTFKVYSQLFGLQIQEIKGAKGWSEGVKEYEVTDAADKKVLGRFYTDLFPRTGKYQHAATFSLNYRTKLTDSNSVLPLSAIVAGFSPGTEDRPSLLTHKEVETFFHEFGHLMHQLLTKAPFASLSGTRVARDFVEAPSQLFENFVWSPQVLAILSGHYKDPSKKLPQEMLDKLIASRNFLPGNFYASQLLLATFDQTIHIQAAAVDSGKLYVELSQAILGMSPPADTNFPSTFGRVMGGHDTAYYGYLWSKVFAEDMFSKFAAADLLNPETGKKFRSTILEQGDRKDAGELIKDFMGRESSKEAFLKSIGI